MKSFLHIIPLFFLLLLLTECAKVGSPAGGDRDRTPPRVRKSEPLNETLNFEKDQVEITFDEYLQQDEIQQELVVSPPMDEPPEIKFRGKTMIVDFQEELRDSTTYTLNFGQSIKDLNEGNILPNFEFVFSTGSFIDSMAVLGSVRKAFDLTQPEEPVFLLLYEEPDDSSLFRDIPDYVSKADEKGNFLINHIRPSTYELYGLVDLNRNLIYDVPEELIAFLDTSITIHPGMFPDTPTSPDGSTESGQAGQVNEGGTADTSETGEVETMGDSTRRADSLEMAMLADADSLMVRDTVTLADLADYSIFVDLFLFREDRVPLYLSSHDRDDRRTLSFIFSRPLVDSLTLEPLNFDPPEDWLLPEPHVVGDTLFYWITDSSIYRRDSLTIVASYLATDSLNELSPYHDTLDFNYRESPQPSSRRRRRDEAETDTIERIDLQLPLPGGQQDLNRPLNLYVSHPVFDTNLQKVSLVKTVDSIEYPVPYRLEQDPVHFRKFTFEIEWEGLSNYRLDILPGAFTDIYGLTHDTVTLSFRTRDPEFYGKIMLNLSGVDAPKVIQLFDHNDNLLRWKTAAENGLVLFDYIAAGQYQLKLIHDRNGNQEWDTGDFMEKRQPERVQFLPGQVTVRKNFDTEVEWDLSIAADTGPPEKASGDETPARRRTVGPR